MSTQHDKLNPDGSSQDGCLPSLVMMLMSGALALLLTVLATVNVAAITLSSFQAETPPRLAVLAVPIGMFVAGVVITLLCEQWGNNRRSGQ